MSSTGRAGCMLVTGATGGVGTAVVRALLDRDFTVLPVARTSGQVCGLDVLPMDVSKGAKADDWPALTGVIHLAALIPGVGGESDASAANANLAMVRWALDVAREKHAALAFASSAFVHDCTGTAPIVEDSPYCFPTAYHETKVQAEELVNVHARESGLPGASLRLSSPYGESMRHRTVLTAFIDAAVAGRDITYHGSGARAQDFIHVEDAADAFVQSIVRRTSGTYLIASGASVAMATLGERIVRLSTPTTSRVVPSGQADPQESCRWHFDVTKARTHLGFSPRIGLDEGLGRLIRRARAA